MYLIFISKINLTCQINEEEWIFLSEVEVTSKKKSKFKISHCQNLRKSAFSQILQMYCISNDSISADRRMQMSRKWLRNRWMIVAVCKNPTPQEVQVPKEAQLWLFDWDQS